VKASPDFSAPQSAAGQEIRSAGPPGSGRSFTVRAVLTGMLLGSVLSIANLYLGLQLGIVPNQAIAGALLAAGIWAALSATSSGRIPPLHLHENNISQTVCSCAALIASAGLATAVPAMTFVSGVSFTWHRLAGWLLVVCLLGIFVAIALREPLVIRDRLPFPMGTATAELLRQIHASESAGQAGHLPPARRPAALVLSGLVAAGWALLAHLRNLAILSPKFLVQGISAADLTFNVPLSPLGLGIGGLIGLRAAASMLLGAIVAWGVLGPRLVSSGCVRFASYRELLNWLVWPGMALMVAAAIVSTLLSWATFRTAVLRSWPALLRKEQARTSAGYRVLFVVLLLAVAAAGIVLQRTFFGIALWIAAISVLLALLLALVAARVAGETGITPVGPMGKLAQLMVGALQPSAAGANLAAANITGGAATQSADLLDDFKCGFLLGTPARLQAIAQICGALTGAAVGSAVYLQLFPRPAEQLLTPEWPAPGVATLKAVAELFRTGFAVLPPGAAAAFWTAVAVAATLSILERLLPSGWSRFLPSPAAVGLGFVIPAGNILTIFAGALIAGTAGRVFSGWSQRYLVSLCAGFIAGESLARVGLDLAHLVHS
jgi:putative OPT family oligopeptide transporter